MPQTVTISIKDDKNRMSKMSINFADDASLLDIKLWVNEFLHLLEPVTKGGFVSASVTQSLWIDPTLRRIPDVTADVEEKLVASFRTEGNYKWSVTFPTFDDSFTVPLVSTKERLPDFLTDEIHALFNHFTVPNLSGFVRVTDKRGLIVERSDKSRYKHRR